MGRSTGWPLWLPRPKYWLDYKGFHCPYILKMSNNIVNEITMKIETTFIEATIPHLDKVELDRAEMDPILQDVISEHIFSAYDWCQIVGTAVFGIGGLVASLFSSNWNNSIKLCVLIPCGAIGLAFLIIPAFLKRKTEYIQEVVSIIDEQISCYQTYHMRIHEWRSQAQEKINDAAQEMKDVIDNLNKNRKRMKQQMKKSRKKP